MSELDRARARIRENPDGISERTLQQIVIALETNGVIDVASLYALDYEAFKIAMGVMDAWWLQRRIGVARNGVAARDVFVDQRTGTAAVS